MGAPEEFEGAEAGFEHDPEVAEEYAESVGTDPTQEEINSYLALAGQDPLGDPEEQSRPGP